MVALLEPNLSPRERLRRLNRSHPLEDLGTRALLLELVRDDDRRWRPWIKACAIDATTAMPPDDLVLFGEVAAASTPLIGPEAAVLHETVAGLRARQLDLV